MKYLLVITMLVLAGCASNSGVVPMSQGKFLITKQAATGFPGIGNLKAEVIQEAVGFCSAMEKDMAQVSYDETKPPFILGNYPRVELHFSCIAKPNPAGRTGSSGG